MWTDSLEEQGWRDGEGRGLPLIIRQGCAGGDHVPVNGGQPSILLKERVSMLQRTSGTVPGLRRFSSIMALMVRS